MGNQQNQQAAWGVRGAQDGDRSSSPLLSVPIPIIPIYPPIPLWSGVVRGRPTWGNAGYHGAGCGIAPGVRAGRRREEG